MRLRFFKSPFPRPAASGKNLLILLGFSVACGVFILIFKPFDIVGEVDGERITVSAGNTVFIPANVAHKWWNDSDQPVEVILVMFGKGA